jgi:hypothetical protein
MSDENASRFEAILSAELAEVRKRRESRARDLTSALADASARGPGVMADGTSDFSPLYPSRRRKRPQTGPFNIQFKEHLKPDGSTVEKAQLSVGNQVPPGGQRPQQQFSPIQEANHANLLGLAFSGGGIRSATFNLGVLQGLARRRLLQRFDYLSTISGGGYIGAWLAAWIHRRGLNEVERRLGAQRKDQPHFKEPPEIGFLREYSNYLTPRKGILGADTWTAIAIYLRNLILNQVILILFIAAILLIPRAMAAFAQHPPQLFRNHPLSFGVALLVVGCAIASFYVCGGMFNYTIDPKPDRVLARVTAERVNAEKDFKVRLLSATPGSFDKLIRSRPLVEIWDFEIMIRRSASAAYKLLGFTPDPDADAANPTGTLSFEEPVSAEAGDLVIAVYPKTARAGQIFSFITLPTFIGSIVIARLLAHYGQTPLPLHGANLTGWATWILWSALVFGIVWLLNFVVIHRNLDEAEENPVRNRLTWFFVSASSPACGALAGFLLWKLAPNLQRWAANPAGMWPVLGFGAPIIALILLASTVIQIGLLGIVFSEPRREWWGRVVGILLIICFVWVAAFFLAGYAPYYLIVLMSYPKSTFFAALAWVASTGLGVFGGKSAQAGTMDSKTWKDAVLSVTPYIFIVGLLMLVSLGIHKSLPRATPRSAESAESAAAAPEARHSMSLRLDVTQERAGDPTLQLKVSPQQTSTVSWTAYWDAVQRSLHGWWVYLACAMCLAVSFLLALRVDLNEFSMHYLYRNRLVRCYLGASNRERVPNPFTGFDLNDDIGKIHFGIRLRRADPYTRSGPEPGTRQRLSVAGKKGRVLRDDAALLRIRCVV